MGRSKSVLDRAQQSASVTRAVSVDRGAIERLPDMIRSLDLPGACQIIADPNTMTAAGQSALAALAAAGVGVREPIILTEPPRLKPRAETARDLAEGLKGAEILPIAVGSGVLNDIVKYAAELATLPYISVATAASMDGYAASGGAMLDGGFKRTLGCAPPVAVIADLDILAKAPRRMAAWGYADLAGKIVAAGDWILADALGEEPISAEPYGLVQDNIRDWLSDPAGVASGNPEALRGLTEGLLISGFAMQAYGNSRPASGSEHQMSHVWEKERLTIAGEPAAHGACVGVGAVAMLALYEWFLRQDIPARVAARIAAPATDPHQADAETKAAFAEPALADAARAEVAAKMMGAERRPRRLDALARDWPALRAKLLGALVSAATMESWLETCRAAAHPEDLAVSLDKLARDYRRARLIRRRYTLLDCLDDLGWLDRAIEELFAPAGFWGMRQRARPGVAGVGA